MQRLLDRFGDGPVSVLDAAWNLLAWNPLWAALLGDPSSWHGADRNLIWRAFTDLPHRIVLTEPSTSGYQHAHTKEFMRGNCEVSNHA